MTKSASQFFHGTIVPVLEELLGEEWSSTTGFNEQGNRSFTIDLDSDDTRTKQVVERLEPVVLQAEASWRYDKASGIARITFRKTP